MNIVQLDTIKINTPSSWNELSRQQLIEMAKYFDLVRLKLKHSVEITAERIMLTIVMLGIKPLNIFSKKRNIFFSLDPDQVYDLVKMNDFLFLKNDLTKSIIRYVRIGFKRYYAPSDGLKNISGREFAFADTFFLSYYNTRHIKWLDKMIAVLYRPAKKNFNPTALSYDGDIRQPFNNHLLEYYEGKISRINIYVKKAILLYYMGCRQAIVKRYPDIFSSSNQSKASGGGGWLDVYRGLAGPKFGDIEKTMDRRLFLLFAELQEIAAENKRRAEKK